MLPTDDVEVLGDIPKKFWKNELRSGAVAIGRGVVTEAMPVNNVPNILRKGFVLAEIK